MAKIERKTKRYPTDLTDEEWSRIEPLLPPCGKTGRKRSVDLREIRKRQLITAPWFFGVLHVELRCGRVDP